MIILEGLLALFARSLGKLLNTAFGWATMMLFGIVPQDRQIYMSILAFGSVTWLCVLLGVLFPEFGVWILSFVVLPKWVNRDWVRMAMIGAALLIPLASGIVARRLVEPEPPLTVGLLLKGGLITLGMSITLIILTLFAPVLKLRNLMRRWASQHIAVIVDSDMYLDTANVIEQTLISGKWDVKRRPAVWMLRIPTRILSFFAGSSVRRFAAETLVTFSSENLEVMLHPSDLVISGKNKDVGRARAVLFECLSFSGAHMTWTKEAMAIEDSLRKIWLETQEQTTVTDLTKVEQILAETDIQIRETVMSYDEWETLFRTKLLLEASLYKQAYGNGK